MFDLDSKNHGAANSKDTGHYPRNKIKKKTKNKKKILKVLNNDAILHTKWKKNKMKTKVNQTVKMHTLLMTNSQLGK